MSKRFTTCVVAVAVTAATFIAVPSASASPGHAETRRVVTRVTTVAAFDFAAGDAPENITVNPDDTVTLSMLGSVANKPPRLVKLSPSGRRITLVTGHTGDMITGNTRGSDGTVYYNVASADTSRAGVWKLPAGGSPRRLAALPTDGLPNGLALDPAGRTLYVADSLNGTVWAVPASGGRATPWLTDPALDPDPNAALQVGVNGLRFHNRAVWVTNFNKATLLKIPVTAHRTAGRIHTVTRALANVDDFNFLNERCDVVFAAQNDPADKITVVYPNGTTKNALTTANGLASPTSTAVSRNRLYVTNAGLTAPHDAKLQRATINLGRLTTPHSAEHC